MRNRFAWRALALSLTVVAGTGCGASMFLRVERRPVDGRLSWSLGGGGNSAVLLHRGGALLVDTKFSSMARRLRSEVEDEHGRSVQRIVLTHSHGDHVGGLALYPRVGAVLVHPNTRRRLEALGVRAPWVEVTSELRLVLGGEVVRVIAPGVAHSDGDLVVLLEGHRALLAGDLVLAGYEPVIDVEAGGDPIALREALGRLLELDFETVLPGHGEPLGRRDVERLRDYLLAVEREVHAARDQGLSEDAAVEAVRLPDVGLEPVPFGSSRQRTVRLVYRAMAGR